MRRENTESPLVPSHIDQLDIRRCFASETRWLYPRLPRAVSSLGRCSGSPRLRATIHLRFGQTS